MYRKVILMKWVTLNDMYKACKDSNVPLLSTGFNSIGSYWNSYLTNFAVYDSFIARRYKSFRYFSQEPINRFSDLTPEHIAEVTDDWLADCAVWLMTNDKKYAELYRINILSDEDYSIIDNYDITETMEREVSKSNTDIYGSRTDTTDDTLGEREDSIADSIGSRQDTSTESIAGFNSEGFENANKTQLATGAQSNSRTNTIGEQENSKTFLKGQQSDSHSGSDEENYTLTRKGNIGVKTVAQILEENKQFWDEWNFYLMIFKELNKEFLLV